MHNGDATLLRCGRALDAAGVDATPGRVLVEAGRVVAAGTPGTGPGGVGVTDRDAPTTDLGDDTLLLPGMVNAHAHLDLTAIGPQPYRGDFIDWVAGVVRDRPTNDDAARASVQRGVRLLREAGVAAVGDIDASGVSLPILTHERMPGVAFEELIGHHRTPPRGRGSRRAADALRDPSHPHPPRPGLQPHAPYSSSAQYLPATHAHHRDGTPLSTHLAETPAERELTARGTGPFRDLLQRLGKWDDAVAARFGTGQSPVAWLQPHLDAAPYLCAHCNDLTDDDVAILAGSRASVAYCPIASEYFGHPLDSHPPHRYRDLLDAGVNVCLGTDSILCQPADEPHPLGLLAPMRCLHQRDGTDPRTLLAMATTHGSRALGLDPRVGTLRPGAPAALITLPYDPADPREPLTQALTSAAPLGVVTL